MGYNHMEGFFRQVSCQCFSFAAILDASFRNVLMTIEPNSREVEEDSDAERNSV